MEDPQPDQTQEQSRPEETAAQEQPTHDLLQASPEPGQQEGATLGSQRGLPEQKDLGSSQNLNQQNELVPQVDENGNPIMQEEKKEIIPEEILEDMKNIYEVFDEEGKNQVEIHELRTILRALDIDPSEDELDFLSKLVDPEQNGYFSYQQLKLVMEEKLKETDTMEDLLEELKKLDRDQDGRIPNPQFKQFMMNLGSKMTLEQVEELMAEADPKGEGAIDIEDLATRLCPPKK